MDDDPRRPQVGFDVSGLGNGERGVAHGDAALDPSFDEEVVLAVDLSADVELTSNGDHRVKNTPADTVEPDVERGGQSCRMHGDMLRWRIACLVSVAIAISYLDRQTLPVAIKAIERDIPITNEQFSFLQSSFLISYALMYAGGGRLVDVARHPDRIPDHHDLLVARLRESRAGD